MRLIDADALKEAMSYNGGCGICFRYVDDADTIDAEPVRQWISVKDRLPMIDEDVLVFAKGKEDGFIGETKIAIAHMTDCMYFGGYTIKVEPRWRCPIQFFLTEYEITHWMPMPSTEGLDDAR